MLDQRMQRGCNFSAGPAALPSSVLEIAQQELLNWHNTGASVMEQSHRGASFIELVHNTEATLRRLLQIPNDYAVLFLHGGARGQFAGVPMNLAQPHQTADYINSGFWARSAMSEGRRYVNIHEAATVQANGVIPAVSEWQRSANATYLHYTSNETIDGVQFPWIPEVSDTALVADMSSDILSQPLDVSRFGLIYASAQKNIGPSGMTLVIVDKELLGRAVHYCPSILNYTLQAEKESMLNTPATFPWYMIGLVLDWLEQQGGLTAIAEVNAHKAAKLYQQIDSSDFYQNSIDSLWRSRMNVPFNIIDRTLEPVFIAEATKEGLMYLKGHIAAGGMRASIYNAVPEKHVDALVAFMKTFEQKHG